MQPEKDITMNIISNWIFSHEEEIIHIAGDIFCHPETAYQESHSSECLAGFLQKQGFEISWNTAGISTAFTAVWGNGRPRLGFLAEYDALPELGHACGHNLLGTGVCAAACALKEDITACNSPGTILVYGCPAEEIMSGKIVMDKAGVFDGLDTGIMWHPFDRNRVSNDIWQSQDIKNYTFHGISAHASRSPEDGRSALDAAELMNIGVNYLREHVPGDVRMHYAYIDNKIPANVVPDTAKTTLSAATMCRGTPLHHQAAARQAGMSIGHKGMLYAARCMAEGTKLLIETPGALEKVWEFHRTHE